MTSRRILFEPWDLGDCVIAASVALAAQNERFILAGKPKWFPILRELALTLERPDFTQYYPLDAAYTTRTRRSTWDSGPQSPLSQDADLEVLSIRGDPRDLRLIRSCFPNARAKVRGWSVTAARTFALLDWPFWQGLLRVQNRYNLWGRILNLPVDTLQADYIRRRERHSPQERNLLIHIGASWQSRQFPHAKDLAKILSERQWRVTLARGPGDRLPANISEQDVRTLEGKDLIDALSKNAYVIANDSGPLHLAAALGNYAFAVGRITNLDHWLPPLAGAYCSASMPKGYRPDPRYSTHEILNDWPSAEIVAQEFERFARATT